jgi:non-ribosomal peptide synthetase component E (peptide arylation enzyme)
MSVLASPVHNVARWIAERALAQPARLAVADAQRRLDYAAFEQRIQHAAGALAAAGVARGDRVAFALAPGSARSRRR